MEGWIAHWGCRLMQPPSIRPKHLHAMYLLSHPATSSPASYSPDLLSTLRGWFVCAICLLALPHIFYLLFKECSVLPPKPTEQLDCHLSTFHPNHRTHLHSCKEEPILLSRWRLSRRCLARDYHSLSQ